MARIVIQNTVVPMPWAWSRRPTTCPKVAKADDDDRVVVLINLVGFPLFFLIFVTALDSWLRISSTGVSAMDSATTRVSRETRWADSS